ncbi:hypothetical protein ACFL1W_00625 [Candidatus Margulisiibacteriota bacterium]
MFFEKNKALVLAALLVVMCVCGCAKKPVQPKLLDSMAALDRLYIPALVFTDLHRQRESEIAMEKLARVWNDFYDHFHGLEIKYGLNITDKAWKDNFDRINTLITTAEVLVKEEQLPLANESLDEVRGIFKDLRHRNGLKYFLDGMTEFDRALEEIIIFSRGQDKLSDKQMERMRGLFRKAQASWTKVSRAELDARIFGFDEQKVMAVKKRIQFQEKKLASFAAALSFRDADRIFQAAQELRPNFVVLYKAFGDFQPIFDQTVRERQEQEKKEQAAARASAEAAAKQKAATDKEKKK